MVIPFPVSLVQCKQPCSIQCAKLPVCSPAVVLALGSKWHSKKAESWGMLKLEKARGVVFIQLPSGGLVEVNIFQHFVLFCVKMGFKDRAT